VRSIIPRGFTFIELLLTLMIVSAVGMLVVPSLVHRGSSAQRETTIRSMEVIRQAIMSDYRDDMFESLPYPRDTDRQMHPQLKYLFHNPAADLLASPTFQDLQAWSHDPVTGRGWSGGYINQSATSTRVYEVDPARGFTTDYGKPIGPANEHGDPTPVDAWGNPIVLQQPVESGGIHSSTSTLFARLVSAGPDGILQTPLSVLEPTPAQIGDDLVVFMEGR